MPAVLELTDVSKHFGSQTALGNVSLSVPKGCFFSLLGPSGCGKTTLLRLVAGFEQASSGDILLNGTRINELRPYQRPVSTVFQNYALFPHLTARGNVEFGLRQRKISGDQLRRKVTDALELLGIGDKESRYPAQLSGGEKQRVALARSLVIEPEILLLDEPLSALDPNLRQQVRRDLKQLQRRVGTTFIFVTHDQEEALSISDEIALLQKGKLQQTGRPEELYANPRNRFVARFLGDVNWLGSVGVRPEVTRISHKPPVEGVRTAQGTVESTTFLGNRTHIETRLASGGRMTAEVARTDAVFHPGDSVSLWWHAADEIAGLPEE